jgi:hypothetical protein
MRCCLRATLLLLITACHSNGGRHQAEVLPTPFPGTVLTARAIEGECGSDGCQIDYEVRITNPTDRDADVQQCALVEPPHIMLSFSGPVAGVAIRAHTVRRLSGRFVLPLAKDAANELVGQEVSCNGLDWHGYRPI